MLEIKHIGNRTYQIQFAVSLNNNEEIRRVDEVDTTLLKAAVAKKARFRVGERVKAEWTYNMVEPTEIYGIVEVVGENQVVILDEKDRRLKVFDKKKVSKA